MSGIAGIIHFDGAPVEPGQVESMTAAMAHRGPDGIRHWVKGNAALGQCMLRTTPESLEETQPLTNEDESLVLVMDGRVDNWEELRRELLGRGAVLRSRADAELVLRAYEVWGRDCLAHIDGDFAFVIWDTRRRTAFCARDRVGNKPFTYCWDGKTLVFASELHAILQMPWIKQELNDGVLAEFLGAEWFSKNETFWKGILRLEPAHFMAVSRSGPKPEQHWKPDVWSTLPYAKDEEYVEHYRDLFADVVRRMSRSHLPLACEVSGGLDSSAIFAMAESLRRRSELPVPAIEGYTLDFHDDPAANELDYARAVGAFLDRDIQEIAPSRMPLEWYRDWAARYGEFPSYPNGVMGLGIRDKARADGCRVLLVGVGGDEWLDGSRSYYGEALAGRHWGALFHMFATDTREAGAATAARWFLRAGAFPMLPAPVQAVLRAIITRGRIAGVDREAWLQDTLKRQLRGRRKRSLGEQALNVRRVGQRGQIKMLAGAYSIAAREMEERLASHAGLELRRPLWHPRIIEFAFATPERVRLQGETSRVTHRQAMKGLLPEAVLTRGTKADFMIAFRQYLPEMERLLTQDIPARRPGWVNGSDAVRVYDQAADTQYGGWPEWMLWALFGCDALMTRITDA